MKKFVDKHRRWFLVLGTTLLFVTFVVKEAIRENVKDKVDEVKSAEVSFAIRVDNIATWSKISDVRQLVGGIGLQTSEIGELHYELANGKVQTADLSKDMLKAKTQSWREEITTQKGLQQDAQMMLHVMGGLIDVQPSLRVYDDPEFRALDKRYEGSIKRADMLLTRTKAPDFPTSNDLNQVDVFYLGINETYLAGKTYFNRVHAKFTDYKEKEENLLGICTYSSYALYAIGLLAALFGKLYGVEGIEAQE